MPLTLPSGNSNQPNLNLFSNPYVNNPSIMQMGYAPKLPQSPIQSMDPAKMDLRSYSGLSLPEVGGKKLIHLDKNLGLGSINPGLTPLLGAVAKPTFGLLGAMLKSNMDASQEATQEYTAYQNEMQNAQIDINRGGMFKYGGKPKYVLQDGGNPEEEAPIAIQAEVGEIILDSSGEIYDVKAKKTHKKMGTKDITDIISPNQYVLSNKLMIKKSEAEKIMLGIKPLIYTEEGDPSEYEEVFLSNLFTKKEHSLAELGKIIKKKYPIASKEQKNNPFAQSASEENKQTRLMLLEKLIEINEEKRLKKEGNKAQKEEIPEMEMEEVPMYAYGGRYNKLPFKNKRTIRADDGFDPKTVKSKDIFNQLEEQYLTDLRSLDSTYKGREKDYSKLNTLTQGGNMLGTLLGVAGIAGQDSYMDTPRLVNPKTPRRIDRSQYDYLNHQIGKDLNTMTGAAFENTTDFGRAMSYVSSGVASATDAKSKLASDYGITNMELESRYQENNANTKNQQSQIDAEFKNQGRLNRNAGTAALSSLGINAINQSLGAYQGYQSKLDQLRMEKLATKVSLYNNILFNNFMKNRK